MDTTALEKAVLGEIWSAPTAYRNLVELCDRFGPRFAGTDGYRGAAQWVRDRLIDYGMIDVHLEPFEHLAWERGPAAVQAIQPYSANIPGLTLPLSARGVVEAELLDLRGTAPEDYGKEPAGVQGKVALVSNRNPPGYQRGVHRKERYLRAVQAGAAGFLFEGSGPGQQLATGSVTNGEEGQIPAVSISAESADMLGRWLDKGTVQVRVSVDGKAPRKVVGHNVVGEVHGGASDGPLVILCGHLDSHDIACGANDNASGSICVLEAVRALSAVRPELPARVRAVLFGGEELGLLGSTHYVKEHAASLDRVRMVLNADVAGTAGRFSISLQDWPELVDLMRDELRTIELEGQVGTAFTPHSDHFPFVMAGLPAAMIGSAGWPGVLGAVHNASDTPDKVSALRLQATAAALARLAIRVGCSEAWPAERRAPEEVAERLVALGLEPELRLENRWPF